ncbi:MAG: response regulator [Lachnospiraceae bacterium]|nr:response regulator [Lachnospiraceae bacterium]
MKKRRGKIAEKIISLCSLMPSIFFFLSMTVRAEGEVQGDTDEPKKLLIRFGLSMLLVLIGALLAWCVSARQSVRKQQEEIHKSREELKLADNARARFLANISQELISPLNTIMGMDEMILREDTADVPKPYADAVTAYARDIRKASESLLTLVGNLLELSGIESEGMKLNEGEYDLYGLLRPLIGTMRMRCGEKGIEFKLDVDELIPKRLYGDVTKIRQILLHLLINSVKYTDMGSISLKLSMEERKDMQCELLFRISDTGMGLKQLNLERIRSILEDADAAMASHVYAAAAGLGISARYASLMEGKLICESEYGEGTEFSFILPQRIIDATPVGTFALEEDNGERSSFVPAFVAPDGEVLVADDDPANLNVVRGLLKATGVFLTTASTGEECLERIRDAHYHVVFLGHLTSGMDGWETLRRIREIDEKLPVYAMSTNSSVGEEYYRSRGFTGSLRNPVDGAALERAIMRHLPEKMMEIHKGEEKTDV